MPLSVRVQKFSTYVAMRGAVSQPGIVTIMFDNMVTSNCMLYSCVGKQGERGKAKVK